MCAGVWQLLRRALASCSRICERREFFISSSLHWKMTSMERRTGKQREQWVRLRGGGHWPPHLLLASWCSCELLPRPCVSDHSLQYIPLALAPSPQYHSLRHTVPEVRLAFWRVAPRVPPLPYSRVQRSRMTLFRRGRG